ncbi:probable DNA-directed RNA polymerase II chain Rpb7 [Rhynchosporium graminicola]|uniref:DNA-directed RNA polymerase subunit n=2 Tax=Rhynchosporium TaxID=38037 RepID=A0A1E1LZ64_RHYSE|nr:probable DNA-directed RNA polymerase II chain Rpb7 [Rhynchosporium commune]CZT42146.1 probable DNA-directed RNA polymerase II chain Rpb7 [Rhynchosporium secalis]
MFFLYNLERQVTLHPSYFGRNMHELVTGKLLKDVEGTCTGRYFIITIMDTFNISEGRILPGSGLAEFTVGYRAVVWRPFKGETVDAIVTSVNQVGFFAEAGPLPLFVSAHLIPSDIKFDPNATPPQFTNNEDSVIEVGTHVRVKIIGTRAEVGEMYAIASIKEDFLGIMSSQHELWHVIIAALQPACGQVELYGA